MSFTATTTEVMGQDEGWHLLACGRCHWECKVHTSFLMTLAPGDEEEEADDMDSLEGLVGGDITLEDLDLEVGQVVAFPCIVCLSKGRGRVRMQIGLE